MYRFCKEESATTSRDEGGFLLRGDQNKKGKIGTIFGGTRKEKYTKLSLKGNKNSPFRTHLMHVGYPI